VNDNSQIDAQRARFDSEAQTYTAHHGDSVTQQYRDKFFRDRLLNIDLVGKRVLDAMCAGGTDSSYLLRRGAILHGLDISPVAADLYTKSSGAPCTVASMHDTGLPPESFDVIYICGGLHHILPLLNESVEEVYRLLRPGGYFCSFEPNSDTWANHLRRAWYRMSHHFEDSESAISYPGEMRPLLSLGFTEEEVFYGGNVAYLVLQQSGVLGVPFWMKKALRLPLFAAEQALPGPSLFWCARWRKKPVASELRGRRAGPSTGA
jgi:SAM-dependent methyltransferase